MRFSTISVVALAAVASARPAIVKKQATADIDPVILQYALTVRVPYHFAGIR
jgi:hypothetical protein